MLMNIMKRIKKITTVQLYEDQIARFRTSGENLSETLRMKLDEDFESLEKLQANKVETEQNLEVLNDKIKLLKSQIKKRNPSEEKFFKEARIAILKSPEFIPGQRTRYKNTFGESITKKKLMEECGL